MDLVVKLVVAPKDRGKIKEKGTTLPPEIPTITLLVQVTPRYIHGETIWYLCQ